MLRVAVRWRRSPPTDLRLVPPPRPVRAPLQVADQVGPYRVTIHPSYLEVGAEVARGFVLHEWPRKIVPGFLADLLDGDLPVTVDWDVRPREHNQAREELRDQSGWHQALLSHSARAGVVVDWKVQQAAQDTERMRQALDSRSGEELFDVAMHLLLRAPDKVTLDAWSRELESRVIGLGGRLRVAWFEQDRVLRACLPQAAGGATRARRVVPTTALAYAYPWTQDSLRDERGLFFGLQTAKPEPVYLDLVRRGTLNMSIFGKSSKGKGYLLKNLFLQMVLEGWGFVGVDQQATREWELVTRQAGGDYETIAPGSDTAINIFACERTDPDDPAGRSPLEEQVEAVREFVAILVSRQGLDPLESAMLQRAILATYAGQGIHLNQPETHDRPAPTLLDLHRVLGELDGAPAANLALRLEQHVTGPMRKLFTGPTTSRRDAPVLFFNIAKVPMHLRVAVLHLVSVEGWRRIRRQERPTIFMVDEGYTLIQHPEGRDFAERLAVGVRQYWGGLWFVSQQGVKILQQVRPVYDNASVHLFFHNPRTDARAICREAGLSEACEDFIVGADEGEFLLEDTDRHVLLGVKMHATPLGDHLATTKPAVLARRKHAHRGGWAFWRWMGDEEGGN